MRKIKYLVLILVSTFGIITTNAQENIKLEPEFTSYYFINKKNEKFGKGEKISKSEKYIFLVIETKNAISEKVTINLEENDGDYIYKNKYLTTKNSIRFKVKKESQKIKLVVYNSKIKKHKRLRETAEKEL